MGLDDKKTKLQEGLLEWAEKNLRQFHWRKDEATSYEVLVAEMFLNVTRTEVVEEVYARFLDRFPDPKSLAEADREEIVEEIRPIGMYNRRADALQEIAEVLVEDGFPETREELLELPRVGDYVANAVLCFTCKEDLPIVDRNVERVYSRVFGDEVETKTTRKGAWEFADEMLPEGEAKTWNLALLDFASLVCIAQSPRCEACFASDDCDFYGNRPDEARRS